MGITEKHIRRRGVRQVTPRNGRVDEAITDRGTAIAASWSPARAFVLDLCDTPDGIKIVEAGCINAAGFYAADMQLLLMAIENMSGF